MVFLTQKKDGKRRNGDESKKRPSKKWWAKFAKHDEPELRSSAGIETPANGTQRETERRTATSSSLAPHQPNTQRYEPIASPALSRASSLSETDAEYLAIQARGRTQPPIPTPGYDADAFAGAFEPAYERLPVQNRGEQSSGRSRQRKSPAASPTFSRISLLSGTNIRSRSAPGTLHLAPECERNTFGASFEPPLNGGRSVSHQQTASPSLSRASSLSNEDTQFLAARAKTSTPRSRPEFNRDAYAGAFEPERQRHRPQTKYPIPPLTKQQLDKLAGAYAPPAPPPRRLDKLDYQ